MDGFHGLIERAENQSQETKFNDTARFSDTFLMTSYEPKEHDFRHVMIVVGLSLAFGLYLILTTVLISKDGVFYIGQAKLVGHDLLDVAERYQPGYPLLLFAGHAVAGLFARDDAVTTWVYSGQAITLLCRILALVVLYFIGKHLVGPDRSILAVMILTVLPYGASYGSDVLREWPFLLFIALGLWAILWASQKNKWWTFGIVGLTTGLGYLIQPTCGQLIVYSLLSLPVMARAAAKWPRLAGAALALAVGFAIPTAPFMIATGQVVAHQLRAPPSNRPPVIVSVAGQLAVDAPIQFSAHPGESIEIAVKAFDPEGKDLQFRAVTTPVGARPIYRLRSPIDDDWLWTALQWEKDWLLSDFPRDVWSYDCIAYYAYARSQDAMNLSPVYRLWSATSRRHLYTTDRSEWKALLDGSAWEQWQDEEIAFYVYTPSYEPADAAPVYKFRMERQRYFWSTDASPKECSGHKAVCEGIAWYALQDSPLPAGFTFVNGVSRWQPSGEQLGVHQVNLIVGDGQSESCQLVQINVESPLPDAIAGTEQPISSTGPSTVSTISSVQKPKTPTTSTQVRTEQKNGPNFFLKVLTGLNRALSAVAENLMVFFMLPLCIGFLHRWRHGASRQERSLMIAIVVLNVGLMLGRYLFVDSVLARRYGLTLVVLTIFYVPIGLNLMAHWLAEHLRMPLRLGHGQEAQRRLWLYVLVAIGIAICVPKLVRPLAAGKEDYRVMARWLQDNTEADAVIAASDVRIPFYAGRKDEVLEGPVNPRKVDYVVVLLPRDDPAGTLAAWERIYSLPLRKHSGSRFEVYESPAR
jgi:hypothetical protein